MRTKLLRIIRKKFTILYYWDDSIKESVIMCRNNKTNFVCYHQGRNIFKELYESVCWQLWNTFDYKSMWINRVNRRNQRNLNKEFNNNYTIQV